jgi:cardiolipin synthase A/B
VTRAGREAGGSGSFGAHRKPAESRRWLKRRVPKNRLYRLAPPRPKPVRFGRPSFGDRLRAAPRQWTIWLIVALALYGAGWWPLALVAGALSFVLYHASALAHPAVYAIDAPLDVDSAEFQGTMEGVTGMPFVPGNRVVIYNNGDEFYPAMLDAIEAAEASITLEQYIYWDGSIGRRFAEALAQQARRGVAVKLLLDAIGSANLGSDNFRVLEAGGCQLAWFHPIHWYTLHRANFRDHRKSLIVDGRIAFTGGAGIGDPWLGRARNALEWRDIVVSVAGPAALAQQSGFAQNWLEATGEILSGERFFPAPAPQGRVQVQTIQSSPSSGAGAVGTMYLTALQSARREILIANPYFIPDLRVVDVLAAARQRGVRVKLMLAGDHIDSWWSRQNSLRHYGRLLEAGIEIYEFQPTMLHQKTMIVDQSWATVGTANLDNRSFALNEETNLCFHDQTVAEPLRAIFDADLERSVAVQLERWRRRGVWQQLKEEGASLIEDQL